MMDLLRSAQPTRRTALALIGTASMLPALQACAGSVTDTHDPKTMLSPTARETARGTFSGLNDHVASGQAHVYWSDDRWVIVLGKDFQFDGAPDPKVTLGADGLLRETSLGPLRESNGFQIYELKSGLDIGDYNEVWIWCKQYDVALAKAPLSLL